MALCPGLEKKPGPVGKLNLRGVDWVIVGGESGPGARPMDAQWVTGIRDQCLKLDVAFFFKQWGGVQKKKTGRTLEGRTWDEMPAESELVTLYPGSRLSQDFSRHDDSVSWSDQLARCRTASEPFPVPVHNNGVRADMWQRVLFITPQTCRRLGY